MKMALKNVCTHTHTYKYNFLVLSLYIIVYTSINALKVR